MSPNGLKCVAFLQYYRHSRQRAATPQRRLRARGDAFYFETHHQTVRSTQINYNHTIHHFCKPTDPKNVKPSVQTSTDKLVHVDGNLQPKSRKNEIHLQPQWKCVCYNTQRRFEQCHLSLTQGYGLYVTSEETDVMEPSSTP